MDALEKISAKYCDEFLPSMKCYLDLAYMISMVLLSVRSMDRQWHKDNIFYSLLRAVFFSRGADIILALCTGESPIAAISCNEQLCYTALVWWLALFVPFDIFNKILNIEAGDCKPLQLLLRIMANLRCLSAVNAGVAASLKLYPGSLIAIFWGTLAGNGSLAVASIFGNFAQAISCAEITKLSFVNALLFTLVQSCNCSVSVCVVHAICALYYIVIEVVDAFGNKVDVVDPVYEVVRKVVILCDLVK